MCVLICLFIDFEGMYPFYVWCSLLWQDIKLCWKPCFCRTVPSSYVRGCPLSCSPQFDLGKTIFYSYYRLFIISADKTMYRTVNYRAIFLINSNTAILSKTLEPQIQQCIKKLYTITNCGFLHWCCIDTQPDKGIAKKENFRPIVFMFIDVIVKQNLSKSY